MKEKSFKIYIFRLLKNVNSGLHITKSAMEALDSVLRVFADRVMDRALTLTAFDNKKTISSSEIATAVRMIFPASLADESAVFAQNAVSKFEDSTTTEQMQMRETKAGLVFSVSASEKYVRRFGQVGFYVSATSPVYLASVLEFLCRRLLEVSGKRAQESDKITITVRHLFLAVTSDVSLSFVNNLGIVFLHSGVEPQVIQQKPRSRSRSVSRAKTQSSALGSESGSQEESTRTRSHRWRPGTKTVMQIRKLQKSADLLIQHAPFNRLVRELVSKILINMNKSELSLRFTGEFFLSLQAYVEDKLIRLMKRANTVATHVGRETVYDTDIQLVCSLDGELCSTSLTLENTIPDASLRQLALRSGIKRYGESCTNVYKGYALSLLHTCLSETVLCATHHGVQTMNAQLLLESLGMRGVYPAIVSHKRKSTKRSVSKATNATNVSEIVPEMDEPDLSDVEEEVAE